MHQGSAEGLSRKWWVFGTIAIGTFISVLDQTSVNVALPSIETHFGTDLPAVQWVTIGYALAISVLLLPMGRLGDMISRKRVYITGLVVFSAGAALAGAAPNLPMLVGFKVFQGAGSAMIQGNAIATILSVFPGTERGKVLGLNLSVVGVGAIVGPAVGGLLVSGLGWRSVFIVPALAGLIAIAAAATVLDGAKSTDTGPQGQRPKFDWLGAGLSGGALLLFLLVMNNGHKIGWSSPPIVIGAVGAIVLIACFIRWELRAQAPMLDVRLFKRKLVAFGVTAGFISFMSSSSVIFLMPFYLQKVLGYSPREAGLIMVPAAVSLTVMGTISGRLSDRFGWRWFNMGGLAMSAVGVFALAVGLSVTSSLAFLIPIMVLNSAGMGLFNSPNNNSILSAVDRSRYGVVSALTQLTRNSANITSIAVSTAIVVTTMASLGFEPSLDAVNGEKGAEVAAAFVAGLHYAYLTVGSLLIIGVGISFFKGGGVREATQEPATAATVERQREPT